MPRYTLDLENAQSFEATEPGVYPMVVDEFTEPERSKPSTKNPDGLMGLFIYFKFQDPELDKYCGRVRRWYALEGKSAGFFRDAWKAMTGEDLPIGQKLDFDSDDAIGRSVNVQIGNEDYNGKPQNTVEAITAG